MTKSFIIIIKINTMYLWLVFHSHLLGAVCEKWAHDANAPKINEGCISQWEYFLSFSSK